MNLFLLLPTGLSILGNKKGYRWFHSLLKSGSEPHTGQHPLQSLRLRTHSFLSVCTVSVHTGKENPKAGNCCFCTAVFWHFLLDFKCHFICKAKCLIPFLPLILYLAAQALEGLRLKKIRHSLPLALLVQFRLLYSLFSFYIISRSGTWSQLILCCFLSVLPLASGGKRNHDTSQLLVDKSWRTCAFACDSFYAYLTKGHLLSKKFYILQRVIPAM